MTGKQIHSIPSFVLDYENRQNPKLENRSFIENLLAESSEYAHLNAHIARRARELERNGIMDMADTLIERLRKGIEPIAMRFQLDLVVLFSSGARGRLRPDSDLNLGFISRQPLMRDPQTFQDFRSAFEPLENDFGRDIDLVEITSRNLLLLKRIWQEGVLLFESQPGYWLNQRLHWRFLVEDNIRYTMNYSILIRRRLETL